VTQDVYEDELDAARDMVRRLGGAKKVGTLIWPDKTVDGAARHLLDCLNPNRAERLSPSQLLLLMRLARADGHHGLAGYLLAQAGYEPPVPSKPADETEAALTGRLESVACEFALLTLRLERLKGMP
jgi:hypothetical protein